MKTRHLFFTMLLLISLTAVPVYGQAVQPSKDTLFRNAVKVNVAAGYFRNVSLFYERYFRERWSFQIGVGYKITGRLPKILGLSDFVIASESGGVKGFSFAPEVRYHFRQCDCDRMTGLYAGAYGKFTKLKGDVTFLHWNGTNYVDVGGAGNLREWGIGLQLGYQFVFKKRFLVDLFFMGPRFSFEHLSMQVDSDFAGEVIPQIEEKLNNRLVALGFDPIEIPVSSDFTVDFHMNNFRYGIGFGYIF